MSKNIRDLRQERSPGRGPGQMGRGPMGAMMMPVEKARDFGGTMKKLLVYLGAYKWTILFICFLALFSAVFMIIGPKILGKATDELVAGFMNKISGTGDIDFGKIASILIQLLILYIISAVFSYFQGFVMSGVTMKVTYRMRNEINAKIHRLPLRYFDKTTHGDIISRITNDVDTVSHTLNQSLTQIITSATSLIGTTFMMLTISLQLTLASVLIIPVTMLVVILIVKKSQKHFKDQQEYLGQLNGHVEEMIGGHIVIKAFNGEEDSVSTFSEYNNSLYSSAWKANFMSGLMMPITVFIGNLAYVAICIFGGYLAAAGRITIGGIQAFIQYIRSFMQPISQIANISNVLQQTAAAAERVFEFINEEEETPDQANALSVSRNVNMPGTVTLVHINGKVEFKNVSFGYDPGKTVIRNFTACIRKGQKVAIVGPTGAGKTTIVKLLMRFYDVDSGAILIDGHDIRLFRRSELRSLFGMVLQDTWLFNGTIAENIRYGKPGASDTDVKNAAVAAQADHFIRTLPDGYDMILNEEASNVSQGQKQLLTIARAILADPVMLILDEATSNVDTRTEVLIQKAMDNLMRGRTSFIIAHRLSTVRNADLILCINNGDIVEQGTHNELIAKNGFYRDLYNSQFDTAAE